MKKSRLIIILLVFVVYVNGLSQTIDPKQSKVVFELSNMGLNTVEGSFGEMSGDIEFEPKDLTASYFDVCIQAKTVDTGINQRDEHLRNEDYFYVKKYPTICFKSSQIVKAGSKFKAEGMLTLHGITKKVEIQFIYRNDTFTGTFEVERLDYNLGPSGGFMVGKTVSLEVICVVN